MKTRRRWTGTLVASLLVGGCTEMLGIHDFEFQDASSPGASKGAPESPRECVTYADCPGQDSTCRIRTCTDWTCGTQSANLGALCGFDAHCNAQGACVGPPCQGLLGLPAPPSPTVGVEPTWLAPIDLDHDDIEDLVVVNHGDETMSLLRGKGGARFEEAIPVSVGVTPRAVVVANLDGDSWDDLAIIEEYAAQAEVGAVRVLLRHDKEKLDLWGTLYAVGKMPSAIIATDLDGDSHLDLAVTGAGDDSLTELFNNGHGVFLTSSKQKVGASPSSLVAVDLDGDEKDEIAVANEGSNDISILENLDGDGVLTEKWHIPSVVKPYSITSARLGSDDRFDLAVVNRGAAPGVNVTLLFNQGNGAFPRGTYSVGSPATSIVPVDTKGEGHEMDLAVAHANGLTMLHNTGNGSFAVGPSHPLGAGPAAMALVNLNGDKRPDIAVANEDGDDVSLLLNDGDGTFFGAGELAKSGGPSVVLTPDLNGDRIGDVVFAEAGSKGVDVSFSEGGGVFSKAMSFGVGEIPGLIVAADFNKDDKVDLAVTNKEGTKLRVLENKGAKKLEAAPAQALENGLSQLAAADMDGDGWPDLVVSEGDGARVLLNQGKATPPEGPRFKSAGRYLEGAKSVALALADLDRDGWIDIAAVNEDGVSVALLRDNGEQVRQDYSPLLSRSLIIASDLNGDDWPDLVVAGPTCLGVFTNAAGAFDWELCFPASLAPSSIAVADMNNDGKPDLIAGGDGHIAVLLQESDGQFSQPLRYALGSSPSLAVATLDFNGDTRTDLAVTDLSRVRLLRNDCLP